MAVGGQEGIEHGDGIRITAGGVHVPANHDVVGRIKIIGNKRFKSLGLLLLGTGITGFQMDTDHLQVDLTGDVDYCPGIIPVPDMAVIPFTG